MWSRQTLQLIEAAYEEDLGAVGDITSALLPGADAETAGRVVMRESGVICGLALGTEICTVFTRRLGQPLEFEPCSYHDGQVIEAGQHVATVRGPRSAVLTVERTLLNFLGRMCGVATLTRRYVEAAQATNPEVKILDTRKTLPGWRELDKYAVHAGGGHNHRFGLYDAILIKDNHLADIPTALLAERLTELLSQQSGSASFVEVEVDNLVQFAEVCRIDAVDIVLLDNFTLDQLRSAVAQRNSLGRHGKPELEASGGIRLDSITEIAATGIDRISIGALTHSAVALDVALDL